MSKRVVFHSLGCLGAWLLTGLIGCGPSVNNEGREIANTADSCMSCHNGGAHNDYAGGGLMNPHPFPGAANISCTTCHGGNSEGQGPDECHIPPPPEIGDEENQIRDNEAYFNRLTLTGIDKFPNYEVDGQTYSALDYLRFINPGDLRVVTQGQGCGECHQSHADCVAKSPLATETGVFSGAMFAIGVNNSIPENRELYADTAADLAFRAVTDPDFQFDPENIGAVGELREFPVFSRRGEESPETLFNNPDFIAENLPADQLVDGRVQTNSRLAKLYHEQIAFTCGDCHLGSAGANNRYGDFRSSGCTACHMPYSQSGRYGGNDPNIPKLEPLDVDDIDAPERSHVRQHRIVSIARELPNGEFNHGMDDYTCAGCHQGSNRTVMQYWGIRLDQNQDVRRGHQYPADPEEFETTRDDTRLFDPEVANRTFNGRNPNQYLLFEDYDGDGKDDTPADVHYEAGLGCIDCHGSHDVHGGTVGDTTDQNIYSRQEQAVAIQCESCHGTSRQYAETVEGITYSGEPATLAADREGNPLKHVKREPGGQYYLTSRLTGKRHYVSQVRDLVIDNGKIDPRTGQPLYSKKASYAMGRDDGNPNTGIGPQQLGCESGNYSHLDNVSCVACHASWTNSCIGCHLSGEYDNNFSNITGERIVYEEENADFVYQSPVPFQLGVNVHNQVAPLPGNTGVFYQYKDINGDRSKVFCFSDRNGKGRNHAGSAPSLGHNVMMPHSIRGKVTGQNEGVRYCVSCHLTDQGLVNFGDQYRDFMSQMATNNYGALDFELLKEHIGQNPGNQLNSPFWVHQAAGLGSGLFLFDENGCPINPLDDNDDRVGCNGEAPADNFDPARVFLNLDKIVDPFGLATGSNNHLMLEVPSESLREGADLPNMSGPLGLRLIQRLVDPDNGIVLDSWLDADGRARGRAGIFLRED